MNTLNIRQRLTTVLFSPTLFAVGLMIQTLPAHSASTATKKSQTKVAPGDSVYSLLRRHGFNDQDRKIVINQSQITDDFVLAPNDIYWLKRPAPKVVEMVFFDKNLPQAFIFRKTANGIVTGEKKSITFQVKTLTARGRVRNSLVESITQATGEDLLAYRFMDAYQLDYNIAKDLKRKAAFEITFEKYYFEGSFVRFGNVLQTALELSGERVERQFRSLKSGGGVFIDPNVSFANRKYYAPVDQIRISSLFQKRRFHPIRKYRRAHEGVDFELPVGSPIYSIADGVVVRSGRNRAAGRFVVVRHNNGEESYYNHMSMIRDFRPGQPISAGTKVGEVGCTGYCTKPHLHFAIKRGGVFINPVYLIKNYSFHQQQEVSRLVAQK